MYGWNWPVVIVTYKGRPLFPCIMFCWNRQSKASAGSHRDEWHSPVPELRFLCISLCAVATFNYVHIQKQFLKFQENICTCFVLIHLSVFSLDISLPLNFILYLDSPALLLCVNCYNGLKFPPINIHVRPSCTSLPCFQLLNFYILFWSFVLLFLCSL